LLTKALKEYSNGVQISVLIKYPLNIETDQSAKQPLVVKLLS